MDAKRVSAYSGGAKRRNDHRPQIEQGRGVSGNRRLLSKEEGFPW